MSIVQGREGRYFKRTVKVKYVIGRFSNHAIKRRREHSAVIVGYKMWRYQAGVAAVEVYDRDRKGVRGKPPTEKDKAVKGIPSCGGSASPLGTRDPWSACHDGMQSPHPPRLTIVRVLIANIVTWELPQSTRSAILWWSIITADLDLCLHFMFRRRAGFLVYVADHGNRFDMGMYG